MERHIIAFYILPTLTVLPNLPICLGGTEHHHRFKPVQGCIVGMHAARMPAQSQHYALCAAMPQTLQLDTAVSIVALLCFTCAGV
jgi:hypothetical protein